MNEKEVDMAKVFENGFPGQAAGKGNAHVLYDVLEPGTPPVELSEAPPDTRPVTPDTEPTIEPATGLPILPPEQAFSNAPFDDLDEDVPGDLPDFLDFF